MIRILIGMGLLLVSLSAQAHNPNTTSVVVHPINGIWTIKYVISQQGADYALGKFYVGQNLQELSEEAYKEHYIKYIKEHFELLVDGQLIPLQSGGIKLGNHQTDMMFLLPDFPAYYQKVVLHLPVFKENEEQHTVVKFIDQEKSFRKVLKQENSFSTSFIHTPLGFEGDADAPYQEWWIGLRGLIVAIGLYYLFKKRIVLLRARGA